MTKTGGRGPAGSSAQACRRDGDLPDLLARIADLAVAQTGRPTATIGVLGDASLRVRVGPPGPLTAPDDDVLHRAVLDAGVDGLDVPDVRTDSRFARTAWVAGAASVRGCAAVPLTRADGRVVGVLAAMDSAPGALGADGQGVLRSLAGIVAALLAGREPPRDPAVARDEGDGARTGHESAAHQAVSVFDNALEPLASVNPDTTLRRVNRAFATLLGTDPDDLVGRRWDDLVHPGHRTAGADLLSGRPGGDRDRGRDLVLLRGDRDPLPVRATSSVARTPDGHVHSVVVRVEDIDARRRAERDWRATHDPATGLPTMPALAQWFETHCASLPDGHLRAVFCLQLINLSSVSAALGPEASTALWSRIGRAFLSATRPDLAVGHLRDTHFGGAVVLSTDPQPLPERLEAIATYLTEAVRGPYHLDGLQVEMQLHVGIVATGLGSLTFIELLRQAETTRDRSPRHVNVADEVLVAGDPTGARNLATVSDLHEAVARDELELHYQPLTPLQAPQIYRDNPSASTAPRLVEALMRWRHPSRGLLPPGAFIPLIEDSRLMVEVTDWALHEAMRQHVRWLAGGLDVRVSVNVSPQVLLDADLMGLVGSALRRSGAAPDRLKIEITESAIVDDAERAREIVAAVRDLGVLVSLDDFGTGYTSLRLLRDFAVDEIKLDRLFVANATANPADAAIANVVGQLGQRLGISTVAEGIEDVETRSLFRAFGYDFMQGYLDTRPLRAAEAEAWLRAHRPGSPT